MKTRFHDRAQWIDYLKAVEMARRLEEDPHVIDTAWDYVRRHMRHDPSQRRYYVFWVNTLNGKSRFQIAALLIEDSEEGQFARDGRPPFGKPLTPAETERLMRESRRPVLMTD